MEGLTIVTGATGGMGAAAVEALASQGRPVLMACRNAAKAETVRTAVLQRHPGATVEIGLVDLSSMASVRRFAESAPEGIAGLFNTRCRGNAPRTHAQCPDGTSR